MEYIAARSFNKIANMRSINNRGHLNEMKPQAEAEVRTKQPRVRTKHSDAGKETFLDQLEYSNSFHKSILMQC